MLNIAKQEMSFIKVQIKFIIIQVIVRPTYEITNEILNNGLIVALNNLDHNYKEWEKLFSKEKEN